MIYKELFILNRYSDKIYDTIVKNLKKGIVSNERNYYNQRVFDTKL